MILADTSVWVDFLRSGDAVFEGLLEAGEVLIHPFIIGELALGFLENRASILADLGRLPSVVVARPDEILVFIERHELMGCGVGYVDVHLLASSYLSASRQFLTHDKKLAAVVSSLSMAH